MSSLKSNVKKVNDAWDITFERMEKFKQVWGMESGDEFVPCEVVIPIESYDWMVVAIPLLIERIKQLEAKK